MELTKCCIHDGAVSFYIPQGWLFDDINVPLTVRENKNSESLLTIEFSHFLPLLPGNDALQSRLHEYIIENRITLSSGCLVASQSAEPPYRLFCEGTSEDGKYTRLWGISNGRCAAIAQFVGEKNDGDDIFSDIMDTFEFID